MNRNTVYFHVTTVNLKCNGKWLSAFLPDSPSPTAARTLTLVAKSVQNLANLVEFGAKVNIVLHTENNLELCFQYTFHMFLFNVCKKFVAFFLM